jgi:hypothetical protein
VRTVIVTAFATGFGLGFLVAAQIGPISLLCVRSVLPGRLRTGLSGLGVMGFGGLLGWRTLRHA